MGKEEKIICNKKHFMDCFKQLANNQHNYTAWSECIEIFALSIINPLTKDIYINGKLNKLWEDREKRYLTIINKYPKEKQELFPQMFACIVNEFKKSPEQDLLGQIYMELGISNNNTGQFFTPYSLCQAMAEIVVEKQGLKKSIKENGFCTINDEACGGGATLIAAVNTAKKLFNRLNYQNHILIYANDIDRICAYMCYIQLSLLPIAAVVTISDAISEPEINFSDNPERFLFTPIYFNEVWTMRRFCHGYDMAMQIHA